MYSITRNCPVCDTSGASASRYIVELSNNQIEVELYRCPICGMFQLKSNEPARGIDSNHFSCYLAYHKFDDLDKENERYHTVLDKEACDELRLDPENGRPVHVDAQMIENWYPKTFAERVDDILLYIYEHTKHIGQEIIFSDEETFSFLFIDRWESSSGERPIPDGTYRKKRDSSAYGEEANYMLNYLQEQDYIKYSLAADCYVTLKAKGYERVDLLQKNLSSGRNAFVAMQFGDKTKRLREAIRKGASEAGYNAIFIDEVEHNNLITPELLKYIRDSKFVVVDLTYENKGAYFEEGYALGIGKAVIQLCQKDTSLHFDIAQKNTIIWENEEDIPKRLANRIRATID